MKKIHHTAVIYPGVEIEDDVHIGAFSVIGGRPEHREFYSPDNVTKGVIIKKGARIFEFVSIHAGTVVQTEIGPGVAVFNHSHIAHDCFLDEGSSVGGGVFLAGHTMLMKKATVCGRACTHQMSLIGPYGFLAPMSFLKGHLGPGELWIGNPARPSGLNKIGLERAGLTHEKLLEIWDEKYQTIRGTRL